MGKADGLIRWAFTNFGPLLVFYGANQFFGLKTAVLASVLWTGGEVLAHYLKKTTPTLFFKFTAAITVVFGLVDLYLQRSFLFRFEAALTSLMVGVFFASTLFGEKPIIQEFAEAQGRIDGELSPDGVYYFKFLTVVWSLYQILKAGFYVWVAERYSLEEGLAIRAVVGNATFYGLLAISIFGAGPIKTVLGGLRFLPSSRVSG